MLEGCGAGDLAPSGEAALAFCRKRETSGTDVLPRFRRDPSLARAYSAKCTAQEVSANDGFVVCQREASEPILLSPQFPQPTPQ